MTKDHVYTKHKEAEVPVQISGKIDFRTIQIAKV